MISIKKLRERLREAEYERDKYECAMRQLKRALDDEKTIAKRQMNYAKLEKQDLIKEIHKLVDEKKKLQLELFEQKQAARRLNEEIEKLKAQRKRSNAGFERLKNKLVLAMRQIEVYEHNIDAMGTTIYEDNKAYGELREAYAGVSGRLEVFERLLSEADKPDIEPEAAEK